MAPTRWWMSWPYGSLAPTLLINNAGFGYFDAFVQQSRDDIEALIEVNIRALTILCRRIGEPMAERRHRAILNVSSFAAIAPIPRYAVYSGAKAYVIAFARHSSRAASQGRESVGPLPRLHAPPSSRCFGHRKVILHAGHRAYAEQIARGPGDWPAIGS